MPVAYTPGLRVTADTTVRAERRLPMRGEVLVQVGDSVSAEMVVARAERPGSLHAVRVAQALQLEPHELVGHMLVKVGDVVKQGDVLARTQGMFGLFKTEAKSPADGTVEEVSLTSGHARIREAPRRIEVQAHLAGLVVEVMEEEGAVIEARAALVQGIFGVGGERRGRLKVATSSPSGRLPADTIGDCAGCVLIAGAGADGEAIRRAAAAGAAGLVVGAVSDEALREYVGYEIGVAITGQEDVPMTLILTEGFGELPMAQRTWELLASLEGRLASINGATQIRAGVIRPEIIVTHEETATHGGEAPRQQSLAVGVRVRVIREPHFGALGRVVELPPELTEIETESRVRIAVVELDSGARVRAPRANLELIQE
jgi:biotin carboxyl carrier protein